MTEGALFIMTLAEKISAERKERKEREATAVQIELHYKELMRSKVEQLLYAIHRELPVVFSLVGRHGLKVKAPSGCRCIVKLKGRSLRIATKGFKGIRKRWIDLSIENGSLYLRYQGKLLPTKEHIARQILLFSLNDSSQHGVENISPVPASCAPSDLKIADFDDPEIAAQARKIFGG